MSKDGLEVCLSQFCVRWYKEDPEFLEAEESFLPPVLGGQRICHSLLFGSALSTFLIIILGDLLLGTQTENKLPFF